MTVLEIVLIRALKVMVSVTMITTCVTVTGMVVTAAERTTFTFTALTVLATTLRTAISIVDDRVVKTWSGMEMASVTMETTSAIVIGMVVTVVVLKTTSISAVTANV